MKGVFTKHLEDGLRLVKFDNIISSSLLKPMKAVILHS